MVEINLFSDMNFWLFLLIYQENEKSNWYDIEKTIKNFLTSKIVKDDKQIQLDHFKYIINNFNKNQDTIIFNKNMDLISLAAITILIPKNYDIFEFLLNQLNVFEQSFSSYIFTKMQKSSYLLKRINLLNHLSLNTNSNVLSFNYTSFLKNDLEALKYINKYNNIHGEVLNSYAYPNTLSPIIIGIDAIYGNIHLNKKDKEGIDIFTKTSRIMDFSDRVEDDVLDKNIKKIIFFGHSLGEADYSYFQSIFDYYDLYHSDLKLIFYYSEHKDEENYLKGLIKAAEKEKNDESLKSKKAILEMNKIDLKRKKSQKIKVFHLINNYGLTLNNINHGKNLLHKLLLEKRLKVANIRDIVVPQLDSRKGTNKL